MYNTSPLLKFESLKHTITKTSIVNKDCKKRNKSCLTLEHYKFGLETILAER